MKAFKRSTALLMVLCLLLGFALSVGPMAPEVNAVEFDPYVFRLGPNSDLIPEYYIDSANFNVCWSSHMVIPDGWDGQIVKLYNLTNLNKLEPTEPADFEQNKRYASVSAFCVDLGTSVDYTGTFYRAANLEEAHFGLSGDSAAKDRIAHIRAILRHGMQYIDNPTVVQNAANQYLGSELVSGLTGAELGSAIQAALWHYANDVTYDNEYFEFFGEWVYKGKGPYQWSVDFNTSGNAGYLDQIKDRCVSQYEPMSCWETFTSKDVDRVYKYLVNLPGESAKDPVITQGALSLEDTIVTGTSSNCDLTLLVGIDGVVDDNDELVLTAKCGNRTETVTLGKNGIAPTKDGFFPITLTGVTAEDCGNVELELTGKQTVVDGVFYEAQSKNGKTPQDSSQGFAGFGAEDIPVYARAAVTPDVDVVDIEITKVDAKSGNTLSGVSFDLYKKQDGDDLKIGSYTTDENGKISVPVVGSDEYYFVETEALPGYEAITGEIAPGRVTNSWKSGSLEITKKLINESPAKPGENFNFKLTLDLSTAPVMNGGISWMTAEYLKDQLESSKDLSWSLSGNKLTATFTLKADGSVTVDSIPLGTTYTLEEVLTDEDREWFNVTSKVDANAAQKGNTAEGTIAAKNAVVFTNSVVTGELEQGDLSITKKLVNSTPAEVNKTFNFRVTLDLSTADAITSGAPWMDEKYLMEQISCTEKLDWINVNGKRTATFTVDADETVTIKGIAQGTTYTVEEVLTAEDQEWFTVTSKVDSKSAKDSNIANGTVSAKNAVLFTNTVVNTDVQFADLNISKNLINETPAEVGETFNFKITIDLSTADAYKNAAPWLDDEYLLGKISSSENLTWTEKDGKYTATFTVDAAETVVIKGLAYGVTYTVEEVLTNEERECFTVTSKVCNNAVQNSNIAEGSIAALNAVLFTNTVDNTDVELGSLSVSKKLVNTTPAEVGETFNFKITIDLSTADVYTDPVFWMNDAYLLGKIGSSENLTWTEKDGKYAATFTVDADETVTINGIAQGAGYTVEEILSNEDRARFTVTSKVGNNEAQNSTIASGSVAEQNTVLFTNTVVDTGVKLGSLNVSKKLVNTTPAEVGETFNFQITVDFSSADAYTNPVFWMNDEYLLNLISSSENLTWTEKDGKYAAAFTVDADETVTINGIAQGAGYTVEEILSNEDRARFTVTSKVGNNEAQNSTIASGSVAEQNTVLFTNTVVDTDVKLGSLNVSKKLVNTTPAEVGETFNFQITVDFSSADAYSNPVFWMNDEYLLSLISSSENLTWTEKDGKYAATFTVDADETVTINGIAQGAGYTVEEILSNEDRARFTVTSKVGNNEAQNSTIASGSVAEVNAVLFTNTVVDTDVELGSLNVSKKLLNTTPAEVGETFNFQITVDFSSADAYSNPVFWMNDEYLLSLISSSENLTWTEKDGKYAATFTVDADETVTINGIAQGAGYTVEEILSNEDRARFTVTSQVDNDAVQNSTIASGSVAEVNAVLFTNTVVDTDVELGDLNVSKKLLNTTPAEVGETFNFQITVDFSSADAYINPVFWMNDEYLLSLISSSENLTWTKKDGKYAATFTVDADETVVINGIAQGTTYTVEEILSDEEYAKFTVTSQVGNNDAQFSTIASGSVAGVNAVLFTNQVITANLELGSLDVSKKLINTTPAEVGTTFNFRITIDLSTADVYTDPVFWMNDEYLMSCVNSAEDLVWTVEDGKYTAIFTVDADETVTIDGIAHGATYTVEEVLTDEDREWFKGTAQIGDGETIEGSVAQSTIAGGNTVIFTNSVVTGPVLVTGAVEVSKELINTTPAEVGETFNFQITIDLSTADVYTDAAPWMNDEYLMSFITGTKDLTWTEADGKYTAAFTVDANETFAIEGIAQGTTYTVQEILTEEEREQFTVTSQIGEEEATDTDTVQSTVAEKNALIFTNSVVTAEVELGSLDVSKKLINTTPAEVGEIFNFQITVDFSSADAYTDPVFWMNDEYLMSFITGTEELTWTAEDGKYTANFTVKADETFTIEGIAHGTTYTVQEILTEEEREQFTVTSQIGEEEATDSDTAQSTVAEKNALVFTNSVVDTEVELGSLDVSKKLINMTPAEVGEIFNFQITVDLSTADAYTDPVFWMNDEYLMSFITGTEELTWTAEDGKYTANFTVKADETFTIEGIALGTTYTVQEILTEEEREQFTVTSRIGEEEAKDSDTAEGTVAEKNALTFTNSVVDTEVDLGNLEISKKLTNSSKAKAHETFNFRITLDLATADVYENPVFWMYDEYLLDLIESSKTLTWTKAGEKKYTATFTLKADETITVRGIAVGTGYTLEEVLSENDRKLYKVTTSVTADGGAAKEGKTSLVSDTVAQENAVIFTNDYVEKIPTTDDLNMTAPLMLCMISLLMAAVLFLNKRRFIG